jgi:uncharacterized sporulation protein YeaH/YhbH (DUF444 family)
MAHFIDRRLNGKNKSAVNRQRFIRRYKQQIKKAVADAISERSVTDISSGENVTIPNKDITEPFFHQGKGGRRHIIHPGNEQFSEGDRIPRPAGGGAGSGKGDTSADGEGSDDFVFAISKDEYLDLLFEDLALPNLQKNQLDKLVHYKNVRAGFRADGVPSNIDIVRSLRGSLARRVAMTAAKKRALAELEQQLQTLELQPVPDQQQRRQLLEQLVVLSTSIAAVPFIDSVSPLPEKT